MSNPSANNAAHYTRVVQIGSGHPTLANRWSIQIGFG